MQLTTPIVPMRRMDPHALRDGVLAIAHSTSFGRAAEAGTRDRLGRGGALRGILLQAAKPEKSGHSDTSAR